MLRSINHPDGTIIIQELEPGKRRISTTLRNKSRHMPFSTWDTAYPLSLIKKILSVKGPAYLCDEIMRDEDPQYVQLSFKFEILGYVDEIDFENKRILDFGCGSGASTMVLSRMFPTAEIVGVELVDEFLAIAELRTRHYEIVDRVSFYASPDGQNLPEELADFDYILLSAVYEHLLPEERKVLLPKVWQQLKPQGVLFIGQTPNILFPFESHTTGLPFINYLPDKMALHFARKYSKSVESDESWERLLRRGIRGGTESEIIRILSNNSHKPFLLKPQRLGVKNRIDLWYKLSSSSRLSAFKYLMKLFIQVLRNVSGVTLIPSLSLAIKKG